MSFLKRIFGEAGQRAALEPLYRAVVATARDPLWYREGRVPDTVEGRFDMVAAVAAIVLLRLEAEGEAGQTPSVLLTELFVDDMDATLRQIGIGDFVVGKHVGRMVGALGGRVSALRSGRAEGSLVPAVRRNIFHDAPPDEAAAAAVAERLERFASALELRPLQDLLAGELPEP